MGTKEEEEHGQTAGIKLITIKIFPSVVAAFPRRQRMGLESPRTLFGLYLSWQGQGRTTASPIVSMVEMLKNRTRKKKKTETV